MKKLLAACAIATLAALGAPAQANVISSLHLVFESGAVFDGTVTFADGYAGMLDTSGTLTGGPWGTVSFGWTWWAGSGQNNPQNYDGDLSTYEDILMGGLSAPQFTHFIGLSWVFPVVGSVPVLDLSTQPIPFKNYWNSIDAGADLLVSGSFDAVPAVPEPGTLVLLGLGLAGLAATRRRKQ